MKNYNKTFTYQLSVDVVVKALLKLFLTPFESKEVTGIRSVDECIKQILLGNSFTLSNNINTDYFVKLVETIIDPIQDNAQALGDLYSTINGWVKIETPLDTIDLRKKDNHVPFPAEQDTFIDGDKIWGQLEQADYVSLHYLNKIVVGTVNYVDNGINVSFKVRNYKTRTIELETVHIEDIVHAENITANVATAVQLHNYEESVAF